MAQHKSAKEFIFEMEALQGKLHLKRCVCCKQSLRAYEMFGKLTGECVNENCRRVGITLDVATLASLTNEDLDALHYPDFSKKG